MLKSIELRGIGPVDDLSANFGERLNVITGDNGLGKSFLLDVCFWSLTGTWPLGRTAIPGGSYKSPTINYDIQSLTRKPIDSSGSTCATELCISALPLGKAGRRSRLAHVTDLRPPRGPIE